MPRSRVDIHQALLAHHASGGCANEGVVGEWYRAWYRLGADVEVELEMQERWAHDVVQGKYDKQLTGRQSAPTVA